MSTGDRIILDDVFLRGDHDTLLLYGPHKRVYVTNSHIQGRADFIASFTSTYIGGSTLETIRNEVHMSHMLFQAGIPNIPYEKQDKIVIRDNLITAKGVSSRWPERVTNLRADSVVYFIDNIFEFNLEASRPVLHFHDEQQSISSSIFQFGNVQKDSTLSPLVWNIMSVPGPRKGIDEFDLPIKKNASDTNIVKALSPVEANSITPAFIFGDWDPVAVLNEKVARDSRHMNILVLALSIISLVFAVGIYHRRK